MSIFAAELRKVWGGRVFPMLLAILAAANLLLLWMGTRPTANQPPASAYRAVGAELEEMTLEETGQFLHTQLTQAESLLKIDNYYRQMAMGANQSYYREQNADLFDEFEQMYRDKSYSLYTDDLNTDYRLFYELCGEYDEVAAYPEFLQSVQTRAGQLAGISIFQNDATGYDLKNIERTAQVYAGMEDTEIRYYPQKGLYTAISYAFTDVLLLASMLVLALILVRQERDSGLLGLVRSLPGGRLHTALAKLAAFAVSLLAVLAVLYGVNLLYCGATFGIGPLDRSIQSVPALMRSTMQLTVGRYLFRFLLAKWAGAFVMGLWVMLAALCARQAAAGWAAALAVPLGMYAVRAVIPATSRLNVIKYANLASLLQTNELLGNYRNLYWFGSPVGLPLVEWLAAAVYGAAFGIGFCLVFCRAQLLPAKKINFSLGICNKTRPTVVFIEEGRKLLVSCGAGIFAAAFLIFGVYQGVTSQSYVDADEIYYAGYMKAISGPFTQQSADWLTRQGEEFAPMLDTQKQIQAGNLPPGSRLCVPFSPAKVQCLYPDHRQQYQRVSQGTPRGVAGVRDRLAQAVRAERHGRRAGRSVRGDALRRMLCRTLCHGAQGRHGGDFVYNATGAQVYGAGQADAKCRSGGGHCPGDLPAACLADPAGLRPACPRGAGVQHFGI